jgi:hypothetical protein
MSVVLRRLTIITLIMTVFAFCFGQLVVQPEHRQVRVHVGTSAPCYHPATPGCVIAL